MGQTNDVENPSLILENLQNTTIEDENNTSLEKSYNIIRNILSEYKLYKNIISKNQKRSGDKNKKKNKNKEKYDKGTKIYSKEELIQMNMNNYNKNVFNDVEHKIERIKKWVKMSKYSTADKNSKIEKSEIIIENKDKINKENKKLILSKYVDLKIEESMFNYYINKSSKFIQRVKKGPPDCFRWCSWCILNILPQDRNNTIYENYTNMNLEKENKDRIIRDIERTFSQQKKDIKELRSMETSLYKILKAYWNLDRDIGYCQGMNLIVGFMLIISNFNERDSFYLLSGMFSNSFKLRKKFEFNIRGLFYEEFPLLNLLNYIFENLLEKNCPNLKERLEMLGITIDLWIGRWFHTLFTLVLPINWCKRVWDNIFCENIFFLVKFGICFTLMIQDDITKMEEEEDILNYFKNFEKYSLCFDNEELNKKCDINKLIEKSQKINIDIDYHLKNYEKKNPSFTQKLKEINDITYEFHTQCVRKATYATILFSDDENSNTKGSFNKIFKNNNSLHKENEEDKEINFSLTQKDNEQNKKNKNPKNLKNSFNKKNYSNNDNFKSNHSSHIKDINSLNENIIKNIDDDINNNIKIISKQKKEEEEKEENKNNIIINKNSNVNLNESTDNINIEYEENIESDKNYDNIIKKNINMHKFENFLNRNRLDIFSQKKSFKTFNKYENYSFLNLIEKNESVGLHRPIEDDISSFIGKNKFKNKFKSNTEGKINF